MQREQHPSPECEKVLEHLEEQSKRLPDPSTGYGTGKGLGLIRTGVVPLIIDIAFMMIRKHSRKLQGREKEKKLSLPSLSSEGSSLSSLQNDNPEDTAVVFKSVTIKNHYLCEIQQFGR